MWCSFNEGPSPLAIQKPLSSIQDVKNGRFKVSPDDVIIHDPKCFMAGELHHHYDTWQVILEGYPKRNEILRYVKDGVSVFGFFKHFKGEFKAKSYDAPYPPKTFLDNNKICSQYEDFISCTIIGRVKNRSMLIWGRKGECEPPHLVLPLTIEPTKPRLCHDERFLNLWMNTPKVSFDQISDLPRYVDKGHFQSKLDDRSGYDHILLTKESRKFFGLFWKGWFLVYNTLPFGWSPSSYIYHSTGLGASHFIRSHQVPVSQYIDDQHVGQLRVTKASHASWSCLDLANAAIFIASLTLVSCGYFIGLAKSVFIPTQRILFHGFISDSVKQAFILDEDKRRKFAFLRESLLNSSYISVRSLQKFAGKVVSFSLAVPAARLFCRQVNTAIGKGIKSSRPVKMSPDLKEELMHWRFLDSWDGFLPWKDERHLIIEIASDASNFGW